jgi:hypothetical protein
MRWRHLPAPCRADTDHHVKEERNEIFVKARAARGLDLVAMRDQLAARREELMEELGAVA